MDKKSTKGQTITYTILQWKLHIEQREAH